MFIFDEQNFILNRFRPYYILSNIKVVKTVFISFFLAFVSNYTCNFIELVCFEDNSSVSLYVNDFESENNDQEPEEENEKEEIDDLDEYYIINNRSINHLYFNGLSVININHVGLLIFIDIPIPPPKSVV